MSWSQKQRAKIIANSYKNFGINGKKVLDVGCGNGVVSRVLEEILDIDLTGTDILDYRKEKIKFKLMTSESSLPFEDDEFDFVMLNDILHHSQNQEQLIKEAMRVSGKALVFEDKPDLFIKIFDTAINYFYSSEMPCPLNFKNKTEWTEFFQNLELDYKIEYRSGKIQYPFWYPIRHFAFLITREI